MTTLISLIGKSRLDPQTGYSKTTYRFDDRTTRTEPFFAMALLDYVKPDKLVLAGTAGSMWDVFFDHQQTDDEATLKLVDAVAQSAVTPALLGLHEQRLTEKLGIPVQCLLIPYARDDAEQTAILGALANCVQPSDNLILDVTHGFRHLPMLALVAARYLTHVRRVQVQEVYYGAREMMDSASQEAPVLRLGGMLRMLDWTEALAAYDQSGNYGVFSDLLQRDGMDESRAHLLAQGAYFERTTNPVQAKQALTGAHKAVRNHGGALGNLFKDALSAQIDWFRSDSRAEQELALADRYLERKDYLRAIVYLYESYASSAAIAHGGDPNNFEDRDFGRYQESDKPEFRLLTHLRNAVAHGVRSWNPDAKRLLQDQQKLDQKLHELRKILF